MKASKYLRKGQSAFLAMVTTSSTEELKIENIPVVCDFPKVFPEDLPGLPPYSEVEFRIELAPGAALIARAPYRLAPNELQEPSTQLHELLDPTNSPWGAPVLFIKKKMEVFACVLIIVS
jgi:hypothetical protein